MSYAKTMELPYNNVFRDYDDYERIIHDRGLSNGYVEESIKFIRLKYQEMLNDWM